MKLLDKTVRNLLSYAILVLLISIPVFYFIIEQLYYSDVDDALMLKKQELLVRTRNLQNENDVHLWLKMDQEVRMALLPADAMIKDTIYPKVYFDTLDREMEPYRELRTVLTVNHKTYLTTIRRSLVESEDLIVGIAEAQAVLLILLFGGWIIINRQTSRNIWMPFYHIIDWLKTYEMGKDPTFRINSCGIVEFDTLNEVVNDLVQKNHGIFTQQKNFIENASHEMQTPVAIMQSKLDLLVGSEGLTSEQARYMQSMYEALDRLNRLNKSLLLLSQIENHQFDDITPVSIEVLVKKILEHLEEAAQAKEISINTSFLKDKILNNNAMLIEICLSNLISNAVNHSPRQGSIHIILDEKMLCLANSGERLTFNEEILFARFGKNKASKNGVGLGLAIVRQITDLMGYKIHYHYTDNKHQFQIKF